MWKFIFDVAYDFIISLQPDVGRRFLHVSNVYLFLKQVTDKIASKLVNFVIFPIVKGLILPDVVDICLNTV